jgi:hypothetical protein
MKTTIAFAICSLVCIYINIAAQNSNNKRNYIIALSGDTNYYDEVLIDIGGGFGGRINGKKDHYKAKEISGLKGVFQTKGIISSTPAYTMIYERKFLKPDKGNDKTGLIEFIFQKGTNKLYRYMGPGCTGAPYAALTDTYYLYEGNKFICYIREANYKEVLTKYFGNCDDFIQKLNNTKWYHLYDLAKQCDFECK